MFSKLKHVVKKLRLADMAQAIKREYDTYVRLAAQQITKEDVQNCIKHVLTLY